MSSILDSLKKLEKETSQQEHLLPRARADSKVFLSRSVIGIIIIVCMCSGAIGLALYYRGVPEKLPEPVLEEVSPPPQTATALGDPKKQLASIKKAPVPMPAAPIHHNSTAPKGELGVKTQDNTSTTEPISSDNDNAQQKTITKAAPVADVPLPKKEEQVKEKVFQEPEPSVMAAEEDKPDPLAGLSKMGATQEEEPVPIDRLEGAGIKIQAISWSEIPEESLAVINNQVLREGDGIEGYHISHINIDDIVLRRGEKSYRLCFRSIGSP